MNDAQKADTVSTGANYRAIAVDVSLLALFTCTIFYKQIILGKPLGTPSLFNDMYILSRPTLEFTAQRLLDGAIPLWNPYWFAGMPHAAAPSSLTFYPPVLLFGFMDFHTAYAVIIIVHVFLCGVFGYFLARSLMPYRTIALLMGIHFAVWLILGNGAAKAGHLWTVITLSFTPLALMGGINFLRQPSHRWAILFVTAITLMIMGGDLQIFSFLIAWFGIMVALYLLYELIVDRTIIRTILGKGIGLLLCIILASLLGAVILLPSIELLEMSIRKHGISYDYAKGFQFRVRPYKIAVVGHALYAPMYSKFAIALALLSFATKNFKIPLIIVLASSIYLPFMVLSEDLYENYISHLPVFGLQKGHMRLKSLTHIAFMLLICIGAYNFVRGISNKRRGGTYGVAFALVIFAVTTYPFIRPFIIAPTLVGLDKVPNYDIALSVYFIFNKIIWTPFILGSVLLLLMVLGFKRPRLRLLGTLLIALALCYNGYHAYLKKSISIEASSAPPPMNYEDFVAKNSNGYRIVTLSKRRAIKSADLDIRHIDGIGMRSRVRGVTGYHSLVDYHFGHFFRETTKSGAYQIDERGRHHKGKVYLNSSMWLDPSMKMALDLLNIKYIIGIEPFTEPRHLPAHLQQYVIDSLLIFENSDPLPAFYAVHQIESYATDELALARMNEQDFDYRTTSVLIPDPFPFELLSPEHAETLTETYRDPEHINIDVQFETPGLLVFSEVYHPGWKVSVDGGTPQKMLRVNTLLRGVLLDAGSHTVQTTYRPNSFYIGSLLSSLGGTIYFCWIGVVVVRTREPNE